MKIPFVTSHLTLFGGGGKFLRDYTDEFCKRGYDVSIIAQKIDKKLYNFNNKISLILYRYNKKFKNYFYKIIV